MLIKAMAILLMSAGGIITAGADVDPVPASWALIETELTRALRQAVRAMDAPDFDEPTHRRRVSELLWTLDRAASRKPPNSGIDPSPVVTRALEAALAEGPKLDAARARRVAELVSNVVNDAQFKPGTIWTQMSTPNSAGRFLSDRTVRILAMITFGGMTAYAYYVNDYGSVQISAVVGLLTLGAVSEDPQKVRTRNQVRSALLECEAGLWRRVAGADKGASDEAI